MVQHLNVLLSVILDLHFQILPSTRPWICKYFIKIGCHFITKVILCLLSNTFFFISFVQLSRAECVQGKEVDEKTCRSCNCWLMFHLMLSFLCLNFKNIHNQINYLAVSHIYTTYSVFSLPVSLNFPTPTGPPLLTTSLFPTFYVFVLWIRLARVICVTMGFTTVLWGNQHFIFIIKLEVVCLSIGCDTCAFQCAYHFRDF